MTREDSSEGGIRENAQRGRDAQRVGLERLRSSCDSVERTGDGSDYYATGCRDGVPDGYHEIKANDAPLTPRQRAMQREHGPRYTVDRIRCDDDGCERP